MKNKRKESRGYIFLLAIVFMFASAVVVVSVLIPGKSGRTKEGAVTANELAENAPETDVLGSPDGDVIFRVRDGETLYLLAESGAFAEYYRLYEEEPIVVIDDGITLDRDVNISGGIYLIINGSVDWMYDHVKIRIDAEGEHTISVVGNEPISRFGINAPGSDLIFEGGDIPFISEVAETQNVASYNGSPTAGAADGDTLGGAGSAKIESVTLYTGKKKTDKWEGAYSEVNGNLVTLFVPHDVSDSDMTSLSVAVDADGGSCELSGTVDLSSPKLIDVSDASGRKRTYRLSVERIRLGIPILSLYTDDGTDITSKLEYKTGRMAIDGKEYTLSVRGRGNASWRMFPKHSYRIKLDSKAKLCGMTADRDWCLIGNYADPSLLRNKVASDMASIMSGLPFTPQYRSVDLFINGEYLGIFMLSEKIEDDEDRVPLGERVTDEDGNIVDMGFLIEFGWDYESENVYAKDYFDTSYCKRMYIKEPKITKKRNAEFKYINSYVKAAENAIIEGAGYEEYIDVDSWVDWFIVNELTNCTECAFYRSLYMYKPVGGKLTAGPIWDYDMAFGNNLSDIRGYDGWASVDFTYEYLYDNWMKFLIKDGNFMSRVRARWAEMKGPLMETASASIESGAAEIASSTIYNFKVWPRVLKQQIGLARATTLKMKTWEEQVDYIGKFLRDRYEWMDSKLS